jgi:Rrf2 family transcriptional regulator, iron-sulfur cluster assembly transcription factor
MHEQNGAVEDMKLTTKGRYAVTAMADLAAVNSAAPIALSDIALRQGISLSYLEQLFAKLKRAELVTSSRGTAGGYALNAAPADIRVADIIEAVDEEIRTTACASRSSIGCQGTTARCLTHDLWDELGRQIEIFLNAVTLEDILQKRVLGMAAVNAPLARENVQSHSSRQPRGQRGESELLR